MRRGFLLGRTFATYAAVVSTAILTVGGYSVSSLQWYNNRSTADTLNAHVDLASVALAHLIEAGAYPEADALCKRLGETTGTRITIIRADGEVVGDSFEAIDRMENHADRPEIRAAIHGDRGTDARLSRTLGQRLTYLAVPFEMDGEVPVVVRASLPLAPLEGMERSLIVNLAMGAVFALVIAFAAGWVTTSALGAPLLAIRKSTDRIAAGDHGHRVSIGGTAEFTALGRAINRLVGEFDDRISDADRHRAQGGAILSSMVEGVLAVDAQSRVVNMNRAAGEMLGITASIATGLPIDEAAPNREVQRFVRKTLTNPQPIEAEFSLRSHGGDVVHGQGTPLRDGDGTRVGALVVLHDVTRLRRLEQVRRDFVSNVSHELKTPITVIKTYVEAVMEGGLDDADRAEQSMRTVAKHADRLNAIIEDLLSLSRIEEDEGAGSDLLETIPVAKLLQNAAEQCVTRSAERRIELSVDCDPSLTARVNPSLLEQAIANLIDNAIQFSDDDTRVDINGRGNATGVELSVRDHGCGIAEEDLPKIFERFYRVDSTTPSRPIGTGLGLAIVQRIARMHGGSVRVDSAPGDGSTFTIEVPQ